MNEFHRIKWFEKQHPAAYHYDRAFTLFHYKIWNKVPPCTMVLWGNFSYPNSNNWKKFYSHFTRILCNTVGRRKLRSNPSCAQLTQWNHELTKLMLISIGNLTPTFSLGVGVGVWPYPNAVGDCWGLTTPLHNIIVTSTMWRFLAHAMSEASNDL